MKPTEEQIRLNAQKVFCQHCKAMQKTNEVVVDCWYNPLDVSYDTAFCASSVDAVNALLAALVDAPTPDNSWMKGSADPILGFINLISAPHDDEDKVPTFYDDFMRILKDAGYVKLPAAPVTALPQITKGMPFTLKTYDGKGSTIKCNAPAAPVAPPETVVVKCTCGKKTKLFLDGKYQPESIIKSVGDPAGIEGFADAFKTQHDYEQGAADGEA